MLHLPRCVSPGRFPWTLLRLWMYSRSLLPFLTCDAKPRRTSWWWRHAPFTPLCIKSSSSFQSKVGSNLNIVSFTIKTQNCWCYIYCPIEFYGVILFPVVKFSSTTVRANTFFLFAFEVFPFLFNKFFSTIFYFYCHLLIFVNLQWI